MKKYIKSKFKVTNLFKLFVWAAHPHSRRGWLMTIIQGVHDVCRYWFWTWMTWIRSRYLGLIRLIFFLCRKPDRARPYVATSVGHTPCFPTTNWRRLTRLKLQHCCKKCIWEAKAPKVLQPIVYWRMSNNHYELSIHQNFGKCLPLSCPIIWRQLGILASPSEVALVISITFHIGIWCINLNSVQQNNTGLIDVSILLGLVEEDVPIIYILVQRLCLDFVR